MSTNELSKRYYKIREVAEILEVPQSTLRFWESQFPEISPKRTGSNQRLYTPKDIEVLRIVHYLLKVKGLKIDMAIREFKHNKKNISKKIEVVNELQSVKTELQSLLDALSLRGSRLGI